MKAIKKENKTFQNLHLEKEEEEEGKLLNTVSERGMETERYNPALPQSEETGADRLRVSGRKRESDKK